MQTKIDTPATKFLKSIKANTFMFTGIVQGTAELVEANHQPGLTTYTFNFPEDKSSTQTGASVALNGTCLTVTSVDSHLLTFDLMAETLRLTNLRDLPAGSRVNYEHAAKMGDEIGGHVLSGHIHCTAILEKVISTENNLALTFSVPENWAKYIFPKGFIAINGASLTVGEVSGNQFTVYLIPETLRITTFENLSKGDQVNIEVDSQTQVVVDTLERVLPRYLANNH